MEQNVYRVGSLSDKGWISDDKGTLSYVFSCYMLIDAAQSLLFDGNLISLPHTYYLHINNPDAMASAVVSDLSRLMGYYFPTVDVRARAKQISGSHYSIIMEVSVITETGERLQLARLMEIDNDNLRKIININNYGDYEQSYI